MSNSFKDRLKTDLQTIKAEGGTRSTRIREILQTAATQSLTELKEGFGEIRTTASQSASNIAQTLSDTEPTKSSEAPSFTTAFNSIRTQLVDQARIQFLNLDAKFAARWGDRYETLKQRFGLFQAWYAQSKANAESIGMTPVEQKQAAIELQVANQGAFVARKEQQIRQQVKALLSATIAKR